MLIYKHTLTIHFHLTHSLKQKKWKILKCPQSGLSSEMAKENIPVTSLLTSQWLVSSPPWVVSSSVTTSESPVKQFSYSTFSTPARIVFFFWKRLKLKRFLLFLSGGVTTMESFQKKFFPSVYEKQRNNHESSKYCRFDSISLTLFTSSLYLAALCSCVVASYVTRKFGRKISMLLGGVLFCAGALLNGFAQAVWMLIVGRLLLGFGIGFTNQVRYF